MKQYTTYSFHKHLLRNVAKNLLDKAFTDKLI